MMNKNRIRNTRNARSSHWLIKRIQANRTVDITVDINKKINTAINQLIIKQNKLKTIIVKPKTIIVQPKTIKIQGYPVQPAPAQ